MTTAPLPHHARPGSPYPLGSTWDGAGTNFAVFSDGATGVEVSLFVPDGDGGEREHRVSLPECTHGVWHGYLPGVAPGTRYGFRADGPYAPAVGARWNSAKLLVDPYARALDGAFILDDAVYDHDRSGGEPCHDPHAMVRDDRDSAAFVPRSVVVYDEFPWGADRPPGVPWSDSVIYELHVKGFTALHPDIPENLRGTFAGLAHPAAIGHLTDLGVTAVELLPVHQFVSEPHLQRRGQTNYWGYNTLGFFAPHAGYAAAGSAGERVVEFKAMVKSLHAAGIEVILDVVYNHTAEGGVDGPTLSLRGLDNPTYYRHHAGDPGRYADYTGCGNTLDTRQPATLMLLLDSLRYWVTEMHVDGFRFDLASALTRADHDVDLRSPFLHAIGQDPVLRKVKLIAEPWDCAGGGYRVGEFPRGWTEWNDRYRDTVRDFWNGHRSGVQELGYRLTGSSDLFRRQGRLPSASLNFITAHDGFTLADLVSYEQKHNEANGEDNRDGERNNRSSNHGAEGPTPSPDILTRRGRAARGMLATLLLSTGTPMLVAGDELGRTQHGNNNAYCLDDETSWLDWTAADADLLAFTRTVLAIRRAHPVFRRRSFFDGATESAGRGDLTWYGADGREMSAADWHDPSRVTLGMLLGGTRASADDARGCPGPAADCLVILHAGAAGTHFTLPDAGPAGSYVVELDTAEPQRQGRVLHGGSRAPVAPCSLIVLRVQEE